MGFEYEVGRRAWMYTETFWGWLRRFDEYIETTRERRAFIFIDNASCHDSEEIFPRLRNVRIQFSPKRTSFLIQPLDLGIIACLKKALLTKTVPASYRLDQKWILQ